MAAWETYASITGSTATFTTVQPTPGEPLQYTYSIPYTITATYAPKVQEIKPLSPMEDLDEEF